jgi:hypothetical protein
MPPRLLYSLREQAAAADAFRTEVVFRAFEITRGNRLWVKLAFRETIRHLYR